MTFDANGTLDPAFAGPDAVDDPAPVLVVDDLTGNLEAVEAVLGQCGCRLVRAQSADEALLALLNQEFAAIVLDIKMPGTGGIELAQIIKARRRTRHVPILFLTAHMIDERDVLLGYGAGAVDYLTKPIHAEILRAKVSVFVDLFQKNRAVARANEMLQREIVERERVDAALREANQLLEDRVRERTEALQRADRRKDEFLASLAHELRNPLAPIRAAVEVLEATDAPEAVQQRARDVVVRQTQHMTRLIDDLLDVGRITNDRLILQITSVDLSHIVEAAVETSRPFIADRKHHLTIDLPSQPVMLHADAARLGQVLANLLTNAAKYTPPGGDIHVTADINGNAVTIVVADTGLGIETSLLPRIFDLFTRGEHGAGEGGLGIGLTLARRLVEMHGGTVEAHSDGPGTGSVFSIRLPIHAATADNARAAGAQARTDSVEAPLPRRRVLIVDDNEDAAEMLSLMLSGWGQSTHVTYDGMTALAAVETFHPDIVLLDIGLPGMSGYDTAKHLRTLPKSDSILLVAVTGWGQDSDRQQSRDAGFNEHLVKPVDPDTLRALLLRQ